MNNLPEWAWIVFGVVFGILFIIDLAAHRGKHTESRGRALLWTIIWVTAGLGFWVFVWAISDAETAHEYLAAYLVEKSLSLDNLFLFLLVFRSLKIPDKHQRTALSWGIFGALLFRAILIFAGVRAVERWTWLEYVFGAVLFYAAWHAFRENPAQKKETRIVQWLSERLRVSKRPDTSKFFISENGLRKATPVFIAVIAIEAADFIFCGGLGHGRALDNTERIPHLQCKCFRHPRSSSALHFHGSNNSQAQISALRPRRDTRVCGAEDGAERTPRNSAAALRWNHPDVYGNGGRIQRVVVIARRAAKTGGVTLFLAKGSDSAMPLETDEG